jgi:hypothetical protein
MSFKEKRTNGEIRTNEKADEKLEFKINDISNRLLEVSTKNQFFGEKVKKQIKIA